MKRLVAFAIAAVVLVSFGSLAAGARLQDDRDAEFQLAMKDGEYALKTRRFEDAVKAFKKASGLRNKTSAEAHFGMARAYRDMIIDHEGVLRGTKIGQGPDTNAWIDGEIRKHLKAVQAMTVPSLIHAPGGTR